MTTCYLRAPALWTPTLWPIRRLRCVLAEPVQQQPLQHRSGRWQRFHIWQPGMPWQHCSEQCLQRSSEQCLQLSPGQCRWRPCDRGGRSLSWHVHGQQCSRQRTSWEFSQMPGMTGPYGTDGMSGRFGGTSGQFPTGRYPNSSGKIAMPGEIMGTVTLPIFNMSPYPVPVTSSSQAGQQQQSSNQARFHNGYMV